jgi:superfamily II DNA or RNA helicase
MTESRLLVAPGELRAALLELFHEERDDVGFVSAAPGLLPTGYHGHAELSRDPYARLSAEHATAHRAALLRFFASDIDGLSMTDEWWERINAWLQAIRAGGAEFRYLPRDPIHTRLVSRVVESYLPGGPLTRHGPELDLRLVGAAHEQARAWLAALYEQSEDLTGEVEKALAESWAGELLSPEDLYLKVLAEYFEPMLGEMDIGADDNPLVSHLTEFQRSAYQAAKGILRRYGGVFLADVVGLGKTYIALALISWLQRALDQHTVVIGPPAILPQWDALASEFRLTLRTVSTGKLDELDRLSDREILVVDESHHFRNRSTLRYEKLQQWLRPEGSSASRKVILLSATPQNNHPRDVQQQLALFPDDHQPLPYPGESMDDFFRLVETGRASLSELLTHVLVRRTRRFIKENYPDATILGRDENGEPCQVHLQFPERVSGEDQCLRYRIDEAYGGRLYDDVMATLRSLAYPLHSLIGYVRQGSHLDSRLDGLRRAGTSVRGLFRVLLLKRLESSVAAFRESLRRLRERLEDALRDLRERGVVRVNRRPPDEEDPWLDREVEVDASLFDADALCNALEHDLSRVSALVDAVHVERGRDTKLERLREYLTHRSPRAHRTLIFSQFADTADYLQEELGDRFGRTALVSGRSGNVMKSAQRFSPTAMRVDVPADEQLDLLIATDVLSEGVNLQDADTLINYDLHWNPVRLIQRAGRIDRIGSEHDEIHIASFMPERGLEANLGLETVLRRRIDEFIEVFGDDSAVLPATELPEAEEVITAYTGEAFARAEELDETDGMSRHFERLNALRRGDPERLDHLRSLRPGKRSTSNAEAAAVAACRVGWHWTFYSWPQQVPDALIEVANDLRGLDLLFAHARTDSAEPAHHTAFSALATAAMARFEPAAELFRQRRTRPRLTPAEEFILRSLDEYSMVSPSSRRELIAGVRDWVLAGQQKIRLQQLGRRWRNQGFPAPAVFQEVAALFRRFPVREEELGEAQLSGLVIGQGSGSSR